ncbi:MAG: hypothetical protein ACSLFQ_16985 [Thermoanaerobaculia bacterium]
MKLDKLLPYIVPPGYVENLQISADGLVRHLGHDVYVMLVEDMDGICRNVLDGDLSCSVQEGYNRAIENLEVLVRAREIEIGLLKGPRDFPFVVAGGHWDAAACLLLPRLHEVTSQHLGTGTLLAAVPSRSSLLVFRHEDDRYVDEMRKFMNKAEKGERKRISNSVFQVTAGRVAPFGATVPAPKPSLISRWFGT